MTQFTEPGVYYYRLTERDPGIAGLTAAPAYLLKARVVNADAADPNGTSFKIDYAALAPLAGGDKVDFIANSYTTYALSLTKGWPVILPTTATALTLPSRWRTPMPKSTWRP